MQPTDAPTEDDDFRPVYDTLTARQIIELLPTLDASELVLIREHEEANKGRVTVLRRIDAVLVDVPVPERDEWLQWDDEEPAAPAAPATPIPVGPSTRVSELPPPPPPPSARRPWWQQPVAAGVAAALLLLATAGVALTRGGSDDTTSAKTYDPAPYATDQSTTPVAETPAAPVVTTVPPSPTTTVPTLDTDDVLALADWFADHLPTMLELPAVLEAVGASLDEGDTDGALAACRQLAGLVDEAMSDLPAPLPDLDSELRAGYEELATAADLCIAGITNNDPDLVVASGEHAMQGGIHIERAGEIMESYGESA